jgi:hypothetical protein
VRPLLASTVVVLPKEMDYTGYDEMRAMVEKSCGRPASLVRRIWRVRGPSPLNPPAADEHAYQLLRWLQAQPLFAGHVVPASDLKDLYLDFCCSMKLDPEPWQTVAHYLKVFTGGERHYRRINRENVRVYPIPKPSRLAA